MDAWHEENYYGLTIKIYPDEDAPNPRRECDTFGHMACYHRRYDLGDKNPIDMNELKEMVQRKDVVSLPLYLYDHSGITMSTGREYPFNDPWDAGQVGYIYATFDEIKKEYSVKQVAKKTIKKVLALFESEVKVYDAYLTGQFCGYVIEDKDGEHVDSCWGFENEKYAIGEAKNVIDARTEKGKSTETGQYKLELCME